MKILVATDAWHPQVNGVVRTLGHVAREAALFGVDIDFLSPSEFWTLPMPSYPEIRLAMPAPGAVERRVERSQPDAIHIATEGPLGHVMRRLCLRRGVPFTTSLHTRFPDYLAGRLPVPEQWTCDITWAWLRRFHAPSAAVLAATPTLASELTGRGFNHVKLWSRGVDAQLFNPARRKPLDFPGPVFLTVGRVAVEKNIEAFLKLDLPGTKLVVGDGPARHALERKYPDAVFVGAKQGEDLAEIFASADVFVFPEPDRHLRPGAARSLGERDAGGGVSGRGAARCDWRCACRRAECRLAARLSGRAGARPGRLPGLRRESDLGSLCPHFRAACD